MSIKVRIWWDDSASCYCLNAAYNEVFIKLFKSAIPEGDRQPDMASHTWYFPEKYGEAVHNLAKTVFKTGEVAFTSKTVASQARAYSSAGATGKAAMLNSSLGSTEDAVVAFMNLVSYDAARKAYREAAQQLHPDKPTGDGEKFRKLTELWSRIEKELYKR